MACKTVALVPVGCSALVKVNKPPEPRYTPAPCKVECLRGCFSCTMKLESKCNGCTIISCKTCEQWWENWPPVDYLAKGGE